MMPQWVGVVLVIVIALVLLWIILFLFGLLFTGDLWDALDAANKIGAVLAGIALVILGAGTLLEWVYTASGLGS